MSTLYIRAVASLTLVALVGIGASCEDEEENPCTEAEEQCPTSVHISSCDADEECYAQCQLDLGVCEGGVLNECFATCEGDGRPDAPACFDLDESCVDEVEEFVACGGNPVGTWEVVNVCARIEVPDESCSGSMLADGYQGGTGTVVFTPDSVGIEVTGTASYTHIEVPLECLANTCAGEEEWLFEGADEGCCGVVNDVCVCDRTEMIGDVEDFSEYTIMGESLNYPNGMDLFCVQGDELRILSSEATVFFPGVTVLRRQ